MTERRTFTIEFEAPSQPPAMVGKTGLAYLRQMLANEVPPAPIQATLGFDLCGVEPGVVQFRLTTTERLANPMGTVHGGVISTLLDSAMGAAVHSTLDERTGYTTLDLTVHMTRAVTVDAGVITAEGRVLHRGRRVVTAEGKLVDARGRLLAHGTTTCLLTEGE